MKGASNKTRIETPLVSNNHQRKQCMKGASNKTRIETKENGGGPG